MKHFATSRSRAVELRDSGSATAAGSKNHWIEQVILVIIYLVGMLAISGCNLKSIIPAPKRSFSPQDLLISKADLPPQWGVAFGPEKVHENDRPSMSRTIGLLKLTGREISNEQLWDVLVNVFPFLSIQDAKEDYKLTTTFPGETDVQGWTFLSALADEQKFSCYTYSNFEYPVCTWVARYDEIEIEVTAWIDPDRLTLEEVQEVITLVDQKVGSYINK